MVKKYEDNPSLTWEERYRKLDQHHQEEVNWLISYAGKLFLAAKNKDEEELARLTGKEPFFMKFFEK